MVPSQRVQFAEITSRFSTRFSTTFRTAICMNHIHTLESEIQRLGFSDMGDPDFLEQISGLMVEASYASHCWILLVNGDEVQVLSDHDEDLQTYQMIASRHRDIGHVRQLAVNEQRTSALRLEYAPANLDSDSMALNRQAEDSKQFGRTPENEALYSEDSHDQLVPLEEAEGHLIFTPVRSLADANIVICLFCQPHDEHELDAVKRQVALISMLGELRASVAKTKHLQQTTSIESDNNQDVNVGLQKALDFSTSISCTLEKEKCAFVLANELKRFLDVDRVTILDQVGNQSRMLAVSGQASFDKRANVVRYTQTLARKVLKSQEPFWFEGDQDGVVKPLKKAVTRYLDESLVQSFAIIPIHESTAPIYRSNEQSLVEMVNPGRTEKRKLRGAILVESIQTPINRNEIERRWKQVQPQATRDFTNAKRHSDLFMLPAMRMLTKFAAFYRGYTARIAWGLTLCAMVLLLFGFLYQDEFRVRCEGYLQPEKMHHVFVRKDGMVTDVLVKEGESVKRGDTMVRLQNHELELEMARLKGELNEKLQARKSLIYSRLDYQGNSAARKGEQTYGAMSKQTMMIENQIEAIQKNLDLKKQQMDDLVVRAPFDGQVMGWNVDRKFMNRPLEEGTRLFTIASNSEQRILELKVPDQRSGYVASAWRENRDDDEKLEVEFSIASFPDERFFGEVTHVNPGLEQDSDLGYVMPLEARPSSELPTDLRSGIPVVAKVICGRRSFIYCKTYEFRDWMHRTVFEYLF